MYYTIYLVTTPPSDKEYRNHKEYKLAKKKAVKKTQEIAKKIRVRVQNTPIYFFNISKDNNVKEDQSVCKAGKFIYIDIALTDHLNAIKNKGIQITVEHDGHYNVQGNKIIGELLTKYFKHINGIIPK